MTVEEKLKKMLIDHGMFEDQAVAVMELVKADKVNESMENRWNDEAAGYPPRLFVALWMSVSNHALEYIDEKCPKAWFRPMFAS